MHLCPLHSESKPSFSIKQYSTGLYWKCFSSCGGGNIIDALVRKSGVSEAEAILRLTGKASGRTIRKTYRRKSSSSAAGNEPEAPSPKAMRLDAALKKIKEEVGQHRNYFDLRGIPAWVAEKHSVAFFEDVRFVRSLPKTIPFNVPAEQDKPLTKEQEIVVDFLCHQILVPGQRLCGVQDKKPFPMAGCFDPAKPYWRNLIRAHVARLPATIAVRNVEKENFKNKYLPRLNLGAYYGGVCDTGNNIVASFCLDCDISDIEQLEADKFLPDVVRRREFLNRVKSPTEEAAENIRLTELIGKIPASIPCIVFQKKASARWHAHGLLSDKRDAHTVREYIKGLLPPELQHIEVNPKAKDLGALMKYGVGNQVRLPFAEGYEPVRDLRPARTVDVSALPSDVPAKYQYRVFNSFVMPITDANGSVRAVKIHKQNPPPGELKAAWMPVGESGHGYMTLWPEPESAERDQFLFVCPGELKALAVIGAGCEGTSITYGENAHRWTPGAVARLKGRRIVVLFDDDAAGHEFRDRTVEALRCHVVELRVINLGQKDGKKIDANDIAGEFGSARLKKELEIRLAAAPDLSIKPFDIKAHRKELAQKIREVYKDRSGNAHLFRSVVGAGKSTAVTEAINESKERFVIFSHSHKLAQEYERKIPDSVRLLSPERMSKEARHGDKTMVECPSEAEIKRLQRRVRPYQKLICGKCPLQNKCPAIMRREQAKDARVLLLQHDHLKMIEAKPEFTEDRIRIIDESCIQKGFRWRVQFNDDALDSFESLLNAFLNDEGHEEAVQVVLKTVKALRTLQPRASLRLGPEFGAGALYHDEEFIDDWIRWISGSKITGTNLLPPIVDALKLYRWIRCSDRPVGGSAGSAPRREYWLIQSMLPDSKMPTIVLDATGQLQSYKALFRAIKQISVWPEADPPLPASEVIQFVDHLFPARSLFSDKKGTEGFKQICNHIRHTVTAKKIDWSNVGIVTLMRLTEGHEDENGTPIPSAISTSLQEVSASKVMHYSALRGRNDIKNCDLVVLIGLQRPTDLGLAETAVTLFDLDLEPSSLLVEVAGENGKTSYRAETVDHWVDVDAESGAEYEVKAVEFKDGRLNLAWDIIVTSELIQALGRARPYEPRTGRRQTVLVFTSQPLGVPVSRSMTIKEHEAELGATDAAPNAAPKGLAGRVSTAMENLIETGPFGYRELAVALGIGESTLKRNQEYIDAVDGAKAAMGLDLHRKRREPGQFQRQSPP